MKTIYKYPFPIDDKFTINLPVGAVVLAAQMQGQQPCLWAEVDTDRPVLPRAFRLFGTGHPMPSGPADDLRFAATFQMGPFVWHLYEDHGP